MELTVHCFMVVLSVGSLIYFCIGYRADFLYSNRRIACLALSFTAAFILGSVLWHVLLEGDGDPLSRRILYAFTRSAVGGQVFAIFALAMACQERKGAIGRLCAHLLRCRPKHSPEEGNEQREGTQGRK